MHSLGRRRAGGVGSSAVRTDDAAELVHASGRVGFTFTQRYANVRTVIRVLRKLWATKFSNVTRKTSLIMFPRNLKRIRGAAWVVSAEQMTKQVWRAAGEFLVTRSEHCAALPLTALWVNARVPSQVLEYLERRLQVASLVTNVASCLFPCVCVYVLKVNCLMVFNSKPCRGLVRHSIKNACIGKNECIPLSLRCMCTRLEGVASANVLQLLRYLGWRPVQLLRHAFLLVGIHAVELLAQISVNHILEKENKNWFVFRFVFRLVRLKERAVCERWDIYHREKDKTNTNLDWEVVRSKAEMVSAADWRKLGAHVHL